MGRIRTIKPELLDDQKCASLSHLEWRLFVSSFLLADDYGNLRGDPDYVRAQCVWSSRESRESVAKAIESLASVSLLTPYVVRGQSYIHIQGWDKHQKVDKRGKPRMPGPDQSIVDTNPQLDMPREFPGNPREDSREIIEPSRIPRKSSTLISDLRTSDPDIALEPSQGKNLPTGGNSVIEDQTRTITRAQPTPVPIGQSAWHLRQAWWVAMLEADARIRASGIQPNAPALPKNHAAHERNMAECVRLLEASGYDSAGVDEKMRHIVLVAEKNAITIGKRLHFKPSTIWKPENAMRAADTSLVDASDDGKPADKPAQPFKLVRLPGDWDSDEPDLRRWDKDGRPIDPDEFDRLVASGAL